MKADSHSRGRMAMTDIALVESVCVSEICINGKRPMCTVHHG